MPARFFAGHSFVIAAVERIEMKTPVKTPSSKDFVPEFAREFVGYIENMEKMIVHAAFEIENADTNMACSTELDLIFHSLSCIRHTFVVGGNTPSKASRMFYCCCTSKFEK